MIPNFSMRYVLIATALTLTLAGALTLTPAASAQSAEANVSVEQGNETAEGTPETVAGSVGPVTIVDYHLNESTFVLILDVETPTQYAMSDALGGMRTSGVTTITTKDGVLSSGRQRLTMDVQTIEVRNNDREIGAVSFAVPEGAVRIQEGSVNVGQNRIAEDRVRLLVIGTAVGAAGFTFGMVRRRREDETKEVERIL